MARLEAEHVNTGEVRTGHWAPPSLTSLLGLRSWTLCNYGRQQMGLEINSKNDTIIMLVVESTRISLDHSFTEVSVVC